MVSLDLGCGGNKQRGFVGVDLRCLRGVDVIASASVLPFREDTFDEIVMRHVIEHVADIIELMEEVWRVSKANARVRIWTPHFTAYHSYGDLTHVRHLAFQSFDYFDTTTFLGKHFWPTKNAYFKVVTKRIIFQRGKLRFWNAFVEKFANAYPYLYESIIGWVFPAFELYFELQTVK